MTQRPRRDGRHPLVDVAELAAPEVLTEAEAIALTRLLCPGADRDS